jgi:DNA-binding NarL/FixJ family response regulator
MTPERLPVVFAPSGRHASAERPAAASGATSLIRVFIVDDHAVVRQGTRLLLEASPRFEIVGEADNERACMDLLPHCQPDLVLLDIQLSEYGSGLQILELLKQRYPSLKVLLFSAHTEMQYVLHSQRLGADGFLSKTVTQAAFHEALSRVMRTTQPVYSPDIEAKWQALQAGGDTNVKLTPRETEILVEVAKGQTNQEIARLLVLSVKTVDTHVANLMKKLSLANRSQLTRYAYEHGWM